MRLPPSPTPVEPDAPRWRILLAHLLLGVVVLAGLFLTVHNRALDSAEFEERWVRTGIFPNRWGRLVEVWSAEGYWRHGGLWRLDRDAWFMQGVSQGGAEQWFDPTTYDPEVPHYYRSNSALFVLPIAAAKWTGRLLGGEGEQRLAVVLASQLIVLAGAVMVGVLAGRLAAACGADGRAALLLGLAAQLVFQANPLNLAAYWDLNPQHLLVIPLAIFLLGLSEPRPGVALSMRLAGSAGLAAVDLPHAFVALGSWAVAAWAIRPEELRGTRLWATILPAVAVVAIVLLQFALARWMNPEARFLGSGVLSRTGLDGDVRSQQGLLDGFARLLWGPVLYGVGRAGTSPVFWSLALAAPVATLLLAAFLPRLRPAALPVAVALGAFGGFVVIFSNAFAIHPYVYPVLLLVASLPALASIAGALESAGGRSRIVTLVLAGAAVAVAMSHLRDFAVHFPVGPGERVLPPRAALEPTPRELLALSG